MCYATIVEELRRQKVEAPKIETQRSGHRSKFWNRVRGLGVSTTALEIAAETDEKECFKPLQNRPGKGASASPHKKTGVETDEKNDTA